jgi:hypothetical protein
MRRPTLVESWVQGRGFPLPILIGLYGYPITVVLFVLITWIVIPVGSLVGWPTQVAIWAAYSVLAGLMEFVVLSQSRRPRAIRPQSDGVAVRPLFGRPFLVAWSSVNPRLSPSSGGFQKLEYSDASSRSGNAFILLSQTQADAVLADPSAPQWSRST